MKSDVKYLLLLYVLYIILVLLISWIGSLIFPISYLFDPTLLTSLANWDGAHLLFIAESGYQHSRQFAFSPLYPSLVFLLNLLINNLLISGIIISWTTSFIALVFLFQVIKKEFTEKIALQSLTYLLLFPTSFYLIATYTEGLFLMLVALTFYFLQRQNKYDLLFATIFTSLALVTRIFGFALLASLWTVTLTNKDLRYRWVVLLAPISFMAYLLYLQINFQNPWLFLTAQDNWDRVIGPSNLNIFSLLAELWSKPLTDKVIIQWLEYIFMAFGIGLTIRVFRHQKIQYAIYCLGTLLIILFSGKLMSVPRFMLVLFPLFIALAIWKQRYSINLPWKKIYLTISTVLLVIFLIRFTNGYWIA